MDRSERIEELATALAVAQGEIGSAKKSAKNPHLGNRYATLDDIIDAVRDPLTKHGISFLQLLDHNESGPILRTVLLHESGQWIGTETTLSASMGTNRGTNQVQAFGGTLTYYRRYALATLLGVSSDEDIDGDVPEQKQPERRSEPTQESTHWTDTKQGRQAFINFLSAHGVSGSEACKALEVPRIGEFDGSLVDAQEQVEAWIAEQSAGDTDLVQRAMNTIEENMNGRDDDTPATSKQKGAVAGALNKLLPDRYDNDVKDKLRHSVMGFLVDKTSTSDLNKAEASALIDWAVVGGDGDDRWEPDPGAKQEAEAILQQIGLDNGQEPLEF